jgi:hypothetical protein
MEKDREVMLRMMKEIKTGNWCGTSSPPSPTPQRLRRKGYRIYEIEVKRTKIWTH